MVSSYLDACLLSLFEDLRRTLRDLFLFFLLARPRFGQISLDLSFSVVLCLEPLATWFIPVKRPLYDSRF
jgi:hypothetical protein